MAPRTHSSTDACNGAEMQDTSTTWPAPPPRPDTMPHPLQSFDSATRDAYLEGHDDGERLGYVAGWRWGATCGALLGLVTCILLAFALGLIVGVR